MNLDTLLQLHADVARNTVDNSQVPPVERIAEVHNRRRVKAGIAITAIAAAAVAMVLLLGGPAIDLTPTTVAPADGGPPATVSEVEPFDSVLQEDPLVLRAELGPEPLFDTSNLGVEQPLLPVETLATSLQQVIAGDIFGGGIRLAIDEVFAVGYLPGTTRNVLVANGKINEPNGPGFGEPAQCVSVSGPGRDPSITGDCHQILPDTEVRPIAIGLFGVNWAGWSFLPEGSSVTVLSVDGVDRFWQRPRRSITIFTIEATPETKLELRVLDANGVEIARGDQTHPDEPTPPAVEPIGGYGDFSDTAYADVDWVQVVTLIVECMNDQGFAATIIPPGVGISYNNIPQDQHWAAGLANSACQAGLNLPEFQQLTGEGWRYLGEAAQSIGRTPRIITNNDALRDLWAELRLDTAVPEADWESEIVVAFEVGHGAEGCNETRFEGIVAEEDVVSAVVAGSESLYGSPQGRCFLVYLPYVYVATIERRLLPAPPFTVKSGTNDTWDALVEEDLR